MAYADEVQRYYPRARRARDVAREQLDRLRELDARLDRTLLATSLCRDEVSHAVLPLQERLLGPFVLGGLAGVPFCGVTGMTAYAHHVPDAGAAMIVYGAHVGMSEQGVLGKLSRDGKVAETNCCGALLQAFGRFRAARASHTPHEPALHERDCEQGLLERMLAGRIDDALDHAEPVWAATEVAYHLIHDRIVSLLHAVMPEFKCALIVTLGMVVVNTSPDRDNVVDVRDQDVIRP
ncbi:MAG: hypothetical protein HYU66_07825 [Armatimonadetes bacterium]|nr:hypothetical protein [Armatimonadota bacterium]